MDGVYIASVVLALLVVLVCERYVAWRDFDRYRRLSRRAHRNLERGLR